MKRFPIAAVLLAVVSSTGFPETPAGTLVKEKEIVLDGDGGFDLAGIDPAGTRLFVAHGTAFDVIDLAKQEKTGRIEGVDGARGIAFSAEAKRGFAAAGKKNRLIAFDLESLKTVKEIETGEGPDVVAAVNSTKEIWCFNGKAHSVTCVDAASLEVKATIKLEGKPELAVEDTDKGLVYVNFEDKSAIGVIDAKKREVVGTHPLAPGEGPTGIALDAKNGLLFAGCANKKLVVMDVATWKVVTTVEIGEHCDGVAFDPGTGNVFASCNGSTGVAHEKDAKTFETLKPLDTPGGKTCALDPATHRFYVVTGPKRGETGKVTVLVFGSGPAAAQAGPLGDLSAFRKIASDTLALADKGDLAGAKTRIKDLETAWDGAEKKMKPMSPSDWTTIDEAIDAALSQLRAGKPDQAKCTAALKELLGKLK
jgi:DNA-binding beta-propeller fold protein YncE